ncbi:hypothetical protein GOM49_08885 [Clostridium bovifaecis]|uniref:Uncharacterized protein n=1 Tax=Clostridium bovifaecis TaxID=2184719 RepID=A0A6I6EY19_9CLOT|nr:hypothetical protein GOM49_08885 [Clostridium bovifaecis]
MAKTCIFKTNEPCNDCGECNKCDLDSKKLCNNCGKCLQLEGYDARAIDIDEIIDDISEVSNDIDENRKDRNEDENIDIDNLALLNKDLKDSDIRVEYIEDIDGLSDLLEDIHKAEGFMKEAFPGLIIVNKNKK